MMQQDLFSKPKSLSEKSGPRLCRPRPAAAKLEFSAHWSWRGTLRLVFDTAALHLQKGSELSRRLIAVLAATWMACWWCASTAMAAQTNSRPNVLLILADDLGYSDLSCYGGEIPTPNIDRLAREGVRFTQFYNSARCCPSRASLLTGLHPHQTGIGSFATARPRAGWGPAYTGHLLPSCVTLAEILGSAGYSTWMVGKWHMGIPGPIERGFQNYYGFKNFLAHSESQWDPNKYVRLPEGGKPLLHSADTPFYATDVFTDYALEFIHQARARKDQPWFLYLAHSAPHFPVQAPRADVDKFVPLYRKGWDVLREQRFERMKKLGLVAVEAQLPPRSMVPVDREDIANGYSGQPNPAWDSLPEDRREDLAYRMATYAAMVSHLDAGVGRLVADLEQHGDLDNTLIFFLSDNGACYEWGPFGFDGPSRRGRTILHTGAELLEIGQAGTHEAYGSAWANLCNTPLKLYKHFCQEGGISTPMIVHWPSGLNRTDAWVRDPGHLMDIVPTVCAAVGAKYPASFEGNAITPVEGESLLPALRGETLSQRPLAFEHQGARALRSGDWKVVWGKRMPTPPAWELYNMRTDRSEQHDLAAERPEMTTNLVSQWEDWAKRVGAEPFERSGQAQNPNMPALDTPQVANCAITITCDVEPLTEHDTGVLVAQGGRETGYALHLVNGHPAFDVRIDGVVTRVMAERPMTHRGILTAHFTADELALELDGTTIARADSPGLLRVQPKDDLSVGEDVLSAAGDYRAPDAFYGKIHSLKVTPQLE